MRQEASQKTRPQNGAADLDGEGWSGHLSLKIRGGDIRSRSQ